VGTVKFEARIKELVGNSPELAALGEPLLFVRPVLRKQLVILYHRLLAIVRDDEECQRLMTTPGVGPVVAPIRAVCNKANRIGTVGINLGAGNGRFFCPGKYPPSADQSRPVRHHCNS
jgi:hypothetical protein